MITNKPNFSCYRQSKKYSCGPASLRIALGLVGLECDENWLLRHMGTKPQIGTSPRGFRIALDLLGVRFIETENATMSVMQECLRRGLPVIVAWNYDNDGHYSVIATVPKRGALDLMDPFKGRIIRRGVRKFLKLWNDPCNGTKRWMLALKIPEAKSPPIQ